MPANRPLYNVLCQILMRISFFISWFSDFRIGKYDQVGKGLLHTVQFRFLFLFFRFFFRFSVWHVLCDLGNMNDEESLKTEEGLKTSGPELSPSSSKQVVCIVR